MNIFKKIDSYLLHHHPAIWVTRLHSFLPIGLGLVAMIFLVNISLSWNVKEDMPSTGGALMFMVVPVLIYLVYWFIFQSRYNVLKSGGKVSILKEYLSYFMYVIVFFVAYLFILIIPISNDQKISNAVSEVQINEDFKSLSLGNSLVNNHYDVEKLANGNYEVENTEYGYVYWDDDFFNGENRIERISRREALSRISNYIEVYNKYTYTGITESAQEILATIDQRDESDYYDSYFGNDWLVQDKISSIMRVHKYGWFRDAYENWFWRMSFAVIAFLALLVWIFKQMTLRYFVFGFISLCLTPLLIGLIAVLLFEVIGLRGIDSELVVAYLIIIAYVVVGILGIRGYIQKSLNPTANVLTMYFHMWIPLLPLFVMFLIFTSERVNNDYYYYSSWNREEVAEYIYWSCIIVGLVSIAIFKPIYAKYRSLPASK